MERPKKPQLTGVHYGGGNRFAWDFGKIPSPKRTMTVLVKDDLNTGGRHVNAAIPVICEWCGSPFWPPWSVLQGCCSPGCNEALNTYQQERQTKTAVMEQLAAVASDLPPQALQDLLAELQDRLAEEQAENDRLRGELGRGITT